MGMLDMGSPVGEILEIIEKERSPIPTPPTPTNQSRTVVDISWDSNKKGRILVCEQGHRFYIVSTKPSGRSAVRCRTKTCPVRGMLASQRDAVTLTGDHSHESGLVEVCVNQLREKKLQEGCEEVSKPPRELWSELRAEVSHQFGQTGEIFLGKMESFQRSLYNWRTGSLPRLPRKAKDLREVDM